MGGVNQKLHTPPGLPGNVNAFRPGKTDFHSTFDIKRVLFFSIGDVLIWQYKLATLKSPLAT
jgi:hypothetical protein